MLAVVVGQETQQGLVEQVVVGQAVTMMEEPLLWQEPQILEAVAVVDEEA
jgi:hypothetical protein